MKSEIDIRAKTTTIITFTIIMTEKEANAVKSLFEKQVGYESTTERKTRVDLCEALTLPNDPDGLPKKR